MPGGTPHELHALDYAVYGYLQRGQDSAARAALTAAERVKATDTRAVIAGYNGTAMKARFRLERGDWRAAAEFPAPVDTSSPMAAALSRFTRAIGSARSGGADAARAEVAALGAIADALQAKQESYWSRVVRIKQGSAEAWVYFAAGDTATALELARAAADSEEVTDKAPVTPAELLPARELQADMLLAVGDYNEAHEAYRATLAREPGRARSIFGAARATELAGDRTAAADGYRDFLRQMQHADGGRVEIAAARRFVNSTGSR
jgi:tetratricopeptide (TPR) repeat protein